ncbi:RNAse R [Malonomonas rubra DSM 5091]|uniref:Ribonuclease R n=2 Tax=Malonomonas rubra TaxID=57040 RepID=A0A1M6D8R3_MALRU|nr:RNAse R [Malonomonas rubra DSM 5091]
MCRFPKRSLNRRDIADMLNLHGGERKRLTATLRRLVADGLIEEKKGCYRLRQSKKSVKGVFSKAEQGFGFVRIQEGEQEDLFIPAKHVRSAMPGDVVEARGEGFDRSGRPYGKIVKVLQRAHKTVLALYRQQGKRSWAMPLDQALVNAIYLQGDFAGQVNNGQIVKVEFIRYPSEAASASGKIVEVLGDPDDPQVDIEAVIFEHELPRNFSSGALTEADEVSVVGIPVDELTRRVDLRYLPLMTIDGETAKDFDDAVAVVQEADGKIRLWVCIADVAYYVQEGGALDQEARERGTSVYFPGFCLPMLPEALSNGICSLNPYEDRLVMTAELLFSADGHCCEQRFYPAVMHSRARLTYTEVAGFLGSSDATKLADAIAAQLPVMAKLSGRLAEQRRQRGGLELDIADAEIILDKSGFPTAVAKIERNQAHRLIEEFMLAANEAVASYLEKAGVPFLYRIHESPTLEKLQDFQQLAAEFGYGVLLGKQVQRSLQQLLDDLADKPESKLLNQQLLRSLQQARYTPENKGHFGLAAENYCHFTSPIRRYPDLTIHRTLKQVLAATENATAPSKERLLELGRDCSERERRAMAAERHLFELRRCQLMQQHIGEQFSGLISSVTEFGFFVELDALGLEGLVHVRSLTGDFYSFDPLSHCLQGERRRKCYRVGMTVAVKVHHVDVWRRRVDFVLAG